LDRDVADLYETETYRINEAVKRNPERFPDDFYFELYLIEANELIATCDRFKTLKHSSFMPKAFTREGCNMLSAVLSTPVAITRSIQIMRAFSAMERFTERRTDDFIVDAPDTPFLPSGLQMVQLREMYGLDGAKAILRDYCGIEPGGARASITPIEARIIRKHNPNKKQRDAMIALLIDRGVKRGIIATLSGLSYKSTWNSYYRHNKESEIHH
ncbi:MAG TPA: ORF6N domain-containing protein, partial [Nitrospirae bacterium]|nr:ORF6N domain-containing protein [Nitrospirota bacterium]